MKISKKVITLVRIHYRAGISIRSLATLAGMCLISTPLLHSIDIQTDSLYIQAIGGWPFGPPCKAIAINPVDSLAYFGSGAGVYTLDISNPGIPAKVSEKIHMKNLVLDLCYDNNKLYGALGESGVEIWDVSVPTAPQYISFFDTPGSACKIKKLGQLAYVADGDSGLRIIDVSNPSNPFEVGHYDANGYAGNIEVISNYVFLCVFDYGIIIIDVSNPTNPDDISQLPDSSYRGATVQGGYLYIACWAFVKGVDIADISDIANPYIVGAVDTAACFEIIVVDTVAYTIADVQGVYVIDVSDVTDPQRIGRYFDLCHMRNVAFFNNHIFVPDKEQFVDMGSWLLVLDVSNPATPQPVGSYDTPCFSMAAALRGDYVCLANHLGGLRIVNITYPSVPEQISAYIPTLAVEDVDVFYDYPDRYAVLTTLDGIEIVNINDPVHPQHVSDCACGDWYNCGVDVVYGTYSTYAYVLSAFRLCKVDITVPNNPWVRDSCFLTGAGEDLFCYGDIYTAEAQAGLRIYDEFTLNEIGFYDTPGKAHGVYVNNDLAYVADSSDGLRIIDVSDPGNTFEIGNCDTPGDAAKVVVSGIYAYIADGDSGLCVVNVSDPASPYRIAQSKSIGYAKNIAARGDTIFLISHSAGLYLYRISPVACEENEHGHVLRDNLNIAYPIVKNSLTINLTLKQERIVTIALYNLLGQKIRLLKGGIMSKGQHQLCLPISELSNGIYFVVLSTAEVNVSCKFIKISD
jgi:hypothetical protein